MHSSMMRTGRSLTVFGGLYLVLGDVPGLEVGVPGLGWVYLVLGGTWFCGGVPGLWGVYLVLGGVPGLGGCT